MIIEKKMYGCKCDNCGEEWADDWNGWIAFTDQSSMDQNVRDDDLWHTTKDGKHYCPNCFCFDDDDNLVISNVWKPNSEQNVAQLERSATTEAPSTDEPLLPNSLPISQVLELIRHCAEHGYTEDHDGIWEANPNWDAEPLTKEEILTNFLNPIKR